MGQRIMTEVRTISDRLRCVCSPAARAGNAAHAAFFSAAALLFAVSTVLTIFWCTSMSTMRAMPMPGGWTMSMTWMLMPGQTWLGVAVSFLGMWVVMMVAMMLPSLVPMLSRYRLAVAQSDNTHVGRSTALVGAGYFFVWTMLGLAAFPLGAALVSLEMRFPTLAYEVPTAVGVIVLVAGALQFTAWKAHHLAGCRAASGCARVPRPDFGTAWRHGLRLGLQCSRCCANLMVLPLVIGVMDLRTMALVAAAITLERLVPGPERIARGIGAVVVGTGMLLILQATGLA